MKKLKILLLVLASLISVMLFDSCSDDDSSSTEPESGAPIAKFTVRPDSGSVDTEFSFDASLSSDAEDPIESLEVRFDFDGDGNFDTDWSTTKVVTHKYSEAGEYNAKLEVKDSGELVSEMIKTVSIVDSYLNEVRFIDGEPMVSMKFEDVELMQFTGLKDKNGAEIFEGDILQIDGYESAYPVEWSDSVFYTTHYSDFSPLYKVMECDGYRIKIIGNIYENPELLEYE